MSQKLRLATAAALTVLAALAVTGCGGSGEQTAARTHFVAEADPICKPIGEERAAINSELRRAKESASKQLAILARTAPGVAADERRAVERLSTLKAPSSLEHEWQTMLAGMRELADDSQEIVADARAKNLNGVHSIDASGREIESHVAAIADRDGFKYCGISS